ncbi:hypothetical protein UFOVP1666_158 [uncultured Caudovirales phage]|uniref:Cytidyltransferase-like domain-containing protein n=1 Tax=uncultured Caudovirales phage TaxID=2100421 RepID=A0A6J5PA68_9CAUD|nr:hypothetical protein UFOVP867_113 [uncultured Caudovirales phage]CAB4170688.1 hypothetical protein UFOVP913_85 [uncultured Caudovirales phage]CAB4177034.1 hypothetical protein UFOVP993_138 [uncultured Caudovirales phage]CAB4223221.1 hypothetical protein UFOVP1666_158 [uncultured Caudovirales phage]
MRQYRQLVESLPKKTVVFSFGRFQPPTAQHELLLKISQKVALNDSADHVIVVSTLEDKKKNPLSVERRLHYLKMMFPTLKFVPSDSVTDSIKTLSKKYKNVIMVAGGDAYNRHIKTISTGERDPDESSSKMISAASKGDYNAFKAGLPNGVRDINGKLLMNDIRLGMDLEVIKERIKYDVDVIREKYFNKEIFNIGDSVESAGLIYEILDRGSNYITVSDSNGEISKKWIQDCSEIHNIKEDIQPGYAPEEISFKGYTTKNLHHSGDATKSFQDTIARYGKHDPIAILNAIKSTDDYMGLNDSHLKSGETPDQKDLNKWKQAHGKAKESLERIGEFQHHVDYWRNHGDEITRMEGNYTPATSGADMNEDLTNKTIKPADKLKVSRIIASFLSVDNPESLSSPEQIVNMGLRKVRTKALNAESIAILHKMLKLADEVGIAYDVKLIPQKLKESIDSRVTVNPMSNYNAAKDVLRYADFKKLSAMNKGKVPKEVLRGNNPKTMIQDDDDMDPNDYDDKTSPTPPDEKTPDTGKAPPAIKVAFRDFENKGPAHSEVGSSLGHGGDSQLRRRKVQYHKEEVIQPAADIFDIPMAVATAKPESKKSKKVKCEEVNEVLSKSDPMGKWIDDFVHSKDKRFEGKSTKERIKMAQGAFYGAQNEEVEQIDEMFDKLTPQQKAQHLLWLDAVKKRNDAHYKRQPKTMQDAINLHLRKGKSYIDAVAASKVHVKAASKVHVKEEVELEEAFKSGDQLKDSLDKIQTHKRAAEKNANDEYKYHYHVSKYHDALADHYFQNGQKVKANKHKTLAEYHYGKHEDAASGRVSEEVEQIDEIFADQGSGSTAKDSAAWEKRRNAVEKMLAKKANMDQAIEDEKKEMDEETINELSPETYASYKKKAGESASAADKAGDFAKGNKRFSGIIKATKKELKV